MEEAYPGELRDLEIRLFEDVLKGLNRGDRPRRYDFVNAKLDMLRISDNGRMLEALLDGLSKLDRITDRDLKPLEKFGIRQISQNSHRKVEYINQSYRTPLALTPEDSHTVSNDVNRLKRMIL